MAGNEHLDANRDGYITAADALTILNFLHRAKPMSEHVAATDELFSDLDVVDEVLLENVV